MNNLYALQVQVGDFWKSKGATQNDALFFGVGIVIIIIILVIVNLIKKKSPTLSGTATVAGSGVKHFSGFTLHRVASNAGLDRDQTKMLEYVFKTDGVVDPERSINSPTLLDRHF
jgi:hypothetical protein